jgi:hypothetical protein
MWLVVNGSNTSFLVAQVFNLIREWLKTCPQEAFRAEYSRRSTRTFYVEHRDDTDREKGDRRWARTFIDCTVNPIVRLESSEVGVRPIALFLSAAERLRFRSLTFGTVSTGHGTAAREKAHMQARIAAAGASRAQDRPALRSVLLSFPRSHWSATLHFGDSLRSHSSTALPVT